MKNFKQVGDVVTIAAPATTTAGQMAHAGTLTGVAVTDAANGANVEIATSGVFELAKVSAQAWTVGQALYYNTSSRLVTNVSATGLIFCGVAAAVAVNPSSTGLVRLNSSAPAAAQP